MSIRALLSAADGSDREVDLRKETIDQIHDHELLWIDITGEDDEDLRIVRDALRSTRRWRRRWPRSCGGRMHRSWMVPLS